MALDFSGWEAFSDGRKKLKSGQEPERGRGYTMYHGTANASARAIVCKGFQPSPGGTLGAGVYCSRDKSKAMAYPAGCQDANRVVFVLKVRVGRVKRIDLASPLLRTTWHQQGYDTAWLPPSSANLEEDCVWDPKRIRIVGIAHCQDAQLMQELQRGIKHARLPPCGSKGKCRVCRKQAENPHHTVRCWGCRAAICPFLSKHVCPSQREHTRR